MKLTSINTTVWFVGFDAVPRAMSKNYSFIYIMRSFLGQRINLVGKSIEGNMRVKLEDIPVKQKGTGGYIGMDIKFKDIPMTFYIYRTDYKEKIKGLSKV
jgi:hypothetical protein